MNRAHRPAPCTRQITAYMGYAGREELTVILTELLEAERAGVRVTHECARTAGDARVAELMRAIEAPARPCSCPLADLSDLAPGRLVAMIEFV